MVMAEADQSRVVVLPDGQNFEQVPADGLENIVEAYKAGNGADQHGDDAAAQGKDDLAGLGDGGGGVIGGHKPVPGP